jgi:hypothetical protein
MSRFAKAVFYTLAPLLVAACGAEPSSASSKPEPRATQNTATSDAYAALTAGKSDDVADVVASVDAQATKDPGDGRAMFYSAIMRLWEFGERVGLPSDALGVLDESKAMLERFAQARTLLPMDQRVAGFQGLANVEVGRTLGDGDMISEGMTHLDEDIAIFPAYAHFLRALASVDTPANSDDFASVIPNLEAVVQTCGSDASATGELAYDPGPLPSALRVCNDEGIVPHVWEGFLVEYGDALLKAGQGADAARAKYRSAMNAPRFDEWPYASELQDRIDHADQRAGLYADGDPGNDPTLWNQEGHICRGCHQDHP